MRDEFKDKAREPLLPGEVQVSRLRGGWVLVEIGRSRYTKRVNLSDDEAAMLVRALADLPVTT